MNNNFKKLLASAMALAMVTSVMPATYNEVSAYSVCNLPSDLQGFFNNVNKAVEEIVKAVGGEEALAEVKADDEFTFDGSEKTIEQMLATKAYWSQAGEGELSDQLDYLKKNYEGCMTDNMVFLQGYVSGVATLEREIHQNYIADNLSEEYLDEILDNTTFDTEARNYFNDMVNKKDIFTNPNKGVLPLQYLGNISSESTVEYENLLSRVNEIINAVAENFNIDLTNEYATLLFNAIPQEYVKTTSITVNGSTKEVKSIIGVSEFTWVKKTTSKTGTSYKLSKLISDIEGDKLSGVKGYEQYGETEDVVEIMDALNDLLNASEVLDDMVAELKDTKAADKLGSALKADAIETLIGSEDDPVVYNSRTLLGQVFADINKEGRVVNFIKNVDTPEFEALREVMEYVEEFFTASIKKSGSRYVTKFEDTDYVKNLEAVFAAAGVPTITKSNLLFGAYVDGNGNKTEQTNYEALVERMEAVAEAYNTVTTGVKGITVNNLSSKNVAKVVNAHNALKVVDSYQGNLTGAEKLKVDDARTNIELLYAKALLEGIATDVVTGWVDLGNGNWDYYDENGNVFTGWVCSAKDVWYYVSNGHMLRDAWVWRDNASAYYVGNDGKMVYGPTTVNGYELDANGLWHK